MAFCKGVTFHCVDNTTFCLRVHWSDIWIVYLFLGEGIMDNAAMNIYLCTSFFCVCGHTFSSLGVYRGEELPGHMVSPRSTFRGAARLS